MPLDGITDLGKRERGAWTQLTGNKMQCILQVDHTRYRHECSQKAVFPQQTHNSSYKKRKKDSATRFLKRNEESGR